VVPIECYLKRVEKERLKMAISLFGSTGFVGGNFLRNSQNRVLPVGREEREAPSADILFAIGTTDNYNIFDNPYLDIDVNIRVMLEVLEANRKKYSKFTFNLISTWFVYGDQPLPFKESSQCSPKGFYSISKYASELFLESYCKTFGINYRILRLGNVYGSEDKGVSKKKNALQYLISNLRQNLQVDLYEGGDVYRDFIHVDDVTRAIDLVILKGELDMIYNIASGTPRKIGDIIQLAKSNLGSSSQITSIPTPDFHRIVQVKDSTLDVTRLKSLGFVESKSLEHEIISL
jgi:nucleoside-diphosphate-sugar epimerase